MIFDNKTTIVYKIIKTSEAKYVNQTRVYKFIPHTLLVDIEKITQSERGANLDQIEGYQSRHSHII